MSTINDRISDLFILMKVGAYDESLPKIMSRIKREMDLECIRTPQPWRTFSYQHTPSDKTLRDNIDIWKTEHKGQLPPRIDVLFSPVDTDLDKWKKSCKHRIPARPDITMIEKKKTWRYMNRAVNQTYELPHHYDVGGYKKRYYALIIEELELYPYDRMETLALNYCRTYPNGIKIKRANTVNLWRKLADSEDATISDLSIIGRAVLREPFAVELLKDRK